MTLLGQSVCVTGAGGSIGSEICRRLLRERISKLTLISLTEAGLYNIERELRPLANLQDCELIPLLGSIADEGLMADALKGVDIVIHAAAHKHVPICERNPIAAIRNNVGGTLALVTEAYRADVQQVVLISSDKAVKPSSVMGATKRVAELILRDGLSPGARMKCATVRFGNVLDSAGSVLPLWREQIRKGGPLTLTDERCERYFMSITEATDLVIGVVKLDSSGLFVFDMGVPRKMIDVARELIAGYAKPFCDTEIRMTGLRPGEKLTEELDYGGELVPTTIARVRRVREPVKRRLEWEDLHELLNAAQYRNAEAALSKLWEIVT